MPAELQPTEPFAWAPAAGADAEKKCSLLVIRDGETSTYPLGNSGRLLIGRATEADIRVDHRSVSREHAALYLGDALCIEDLGGANGTRVRDIPVQPGSRVEVFPDDVIDLGAVLLVVQYRRLEQRLRRSCDWAFFELRLEEECERAQLSALPFTPARLEIEGGLGAHAIQLFLASDLEQTDLVASNGSTGYVILLPGVTPAEAGVRVERSVERLTPARLDGSHGSARPSAQTCRNVCMPPVPSWAPSHTARRGTPRPRALNAGSSSRKSAIPNACSRCGRPASRVRRELARRSAEF